MYNASLSYRSALLRLSFCNWDQLQGCSFLLRTFRRSSRYRIVWTFGLSYWSYWSCIYHHHCHLIHIHIHIHAYSSIHIESVYGVPHSLSIYLSTYVEHILPRISSTACLLSIIQEFEIVQTFERNHLYLGCH